MRRLVVVHGEQSAECRIDAENGKVTAGYDLGSRGNVFFAGGERNGSESTAEYDLEKPVLFLEVAADRV